MNNSDNVKVYEISGMSCNHCKLAVEEAIRNSTGVKSVNVDLASGTARVEGTVSDAEIFTAVQEAGYVASLSNSTT